MSSCQQLLQGHGDVFRRKKKSRWKRKDKSTYRFKHEWLFKGLVFVAIFTLRLNSGACNGVLHPKSSPSANLTIEIRGYIKTADSKLPTLTLEDNIKLPTTAPGAGYVFRRKTNLVGEERTNPLTVSNTSGCSRVLSWWQSSPCD